MLRCWSLAHDLEKLINPEHYHYPVSFKLSCPRHLLFGRWPKNNLKLISAAEKSPTRFRSWVSQGTSCLVVVQVEGLSLGLPYMLFMCYMSAVYASWNREMRLNDLAVEGWNQLLNGLPANLVSVEASAMRLLGSDQLDYDVNNDETVIRQTKNHTDWLNFPLCYSVLSGPSGKAFLFCPL